MITAMTGRRLFPRLAVLLAAMATAASSQVDIGDPSGSTLGQRGPVIYGYVTTTTGKPVAGARVEAYLRSEFRTDYAFSNDQGFYSLSLTQESDFWEIRVRASGYRPTSERISVWRSRVRQDFTLTEEPRTPACGQGRRARAQARELMQQGLDKAAPASAAAIALLRRALGSIPPRRGAQQPGRPAAPRGRSRRRRGRVRKAADLAPLDYSHFNLGTLLHDGGRFAEAARGARTGDAGDPTAPMAAAYLGRSYIGLRKGTEALEHLETAERLSSGKLDLQLEMSDAWVLQGNLAQALAAKEAWLERHRDDPRGAQVQETIVKLRQKLAASGSA
jgi:tetratricopeptide (TPR) repeat protein